MAELLKISDIAKLARNQWGSIFPALGITVPARGKHGACPVCGGKDRFRVDDKEGKGTWFCNQCDPQAGDGINLVSRVTGKPLIEAANMVAQFLRLSAGLDMAAIKANEARAKQQAEQERQREQAKHKAAAEQAQNILNQCQPAKGHPYLVGKGLSESEALILQSPIAGKVQGLLVVPLYNTAGELTTCQTIDDAGNKRLLAGGQKVGSFHCIAGSEVLAICEGYATGLSIYLATGVTVYVAIDAGNLLSVAKTVRTLNPHSRITLAADNDAASPVNTGLIKAQEASVSVGGVVVLPPVPGDWNDYHQQFGIKKTRETLLMSSKQQSNVVPLADKAKPATKSSADDLKPRIETKGNDLVYIVPKMDKDSGEIHETQIWLCTAMELIGRGKDEDGSYFRIIRWQEDDTGAERTDAIPMEIVGENECWARMRRGGLSVTTARTYRAHLGNHMQVAGSKQHWHVVSSSGWQHDAYVLPNAEVVGNPVDPVFFNGRSASANAYRVKGTAAGWREKSGVQAQGNDCMMLGVACSLAAPLLDLIEADSFGVHLFGNSGTGKTTIAMVANSVWGHPEALKLSWYATALGLANEAAAHNDGLMSLDEIGQSTKPKDVATAAYALFNGIGKIQGAKDGGNREAMRWRVLALSTGEKDLETFLHEAGEKAHAGHLVRLLNIPIQKIVNLHGYSDSRAHADAIQHSTKCCYGALGREWVKYLSENKELVIDAIRTAISQWQNRLPAGASDQVRRVASRFAILEAALITATQFTGWGVNESKDAVTHCFDQWVALFGMENKEQRTIIEQAIAFLSVHGRSRYSSIVKGCDVPCDPDQSPIRELAGYRLLDNKQTGQQIYYTFPHVFEKEVSKGFNPKMVAQTLSDIGMLEKEKGKRGGFKKKGPRLDGVQQRFYVLKLIDEDNIDPEDEI